MFVVLQSCPGWLKSLVGVCSRQADVLHTPPWPLGGHLLPLVGWPKAEGPLQCPLPSLHGLPLPSVMVQVPVFAHGPVAMLWSSKMSSRTTQKQLHPAVSGRLASCEYLQSLSETVCVLTFALSSPCGFTSWFYPDFLCGIGGSLPGFVLSISQ